MRTRLLLGSPRSSRDIQKNLYDRAKELRDSNTVRIDTKEDFYDFFTPKNKEKPEIHGGFALAHWSGSPEVEAQIKEELKVTIRCIPFDQEVRDDRPGKLCRSQESQVRAAYCSRNPISSQSRRKRRLQPLPAAPQGCTRSMRFAAPDRASHRTCGARSRGRDAIRRRHNRASS